MLAERRRPPEWWCRRYEQILAVPSCSSKKTKGRTGYRRPRGLRRHFPIYREKREEVAVA